VMDSDDWRRIHLLVLIEKADVLMNGEDDDNANAKTPLPLRRTNAAVMK
jgi:hypothetical protein